MQKSSAWGGQLPAKKSLLSIAIATALFSAAAPSHALGLTTVTGVVAGSYFTPPVNSNNPANGVASTTAPSVYAGAQVCFDLNNNGICDANEPTTISKSDGTFLLSSLSAGNVIAAISTNATNNGNPVASRAVFRVSAAQIAAAKVSPLAPISVAVTPISTEIVRMIENDGLTYAQAQTGLAERLSVSTTDLVSNPGAITNTADQAAILNESVVLTNRFTYAATMMDRGDVATIPAADQAAMALEGIPRYDHIFIIMLENKATLSVLGNEYTPNINAILAANNQFTNYFATGNPSEPNYTALGGADDWGITNDDQWNCNATGVNAPQDLPLPTNTQPGLGKSPLTATCTDSPVVDHNIVGHANLFNAMTSAGMTWRTYNESTNPGQDFRTDSVADAAVVAPDHVYPAGTIYTGSAAVGDSTGLIPMPAQLYRTKHHPGMAYQNVRSAPEFTSSNRTMGGGQWTPYLLKSTDYAIPAGYDPDQFGTDLATGNVGQLNFVIPDQCDDMHSITVKGTDSVTNGSITASDCGGVSNGNAPPINVTTDIIMKRGDNYVQYLVNKIQASALWQNPYQRNAIVIMFDEGNATTGNNSCCGWNPGNSTVAQPLISNAAGTSTTVDTTIANYYYGNRGHGNSIFAVLTNQPSAPKRIRDSDAYSHFSFVRTLQDMFGLADPDNDGTYMNRSKYTQNFIAENILNLPEYASAADPHFDAVRPMNHQYVIPAGYVELISNDQNTTPQVGPDANQTNVWALPTSVQ
jgi:hypothetical protein